MKKVIMSLLVIALVAGLMGSGLFARFSDTETSTGNIIRAGTIDLTVDGENNVDKVIKSFTEIKPCQDLAPFEVTIANIGNNEGKVSWRISIIDKDKPWGETEMDMNPDFEFASGNTTGDPAINYELSGNEMVALIFVKSVKFDRNGNGTYEDNGANGIPCDKESSWLGLSTGDPQINSTTGIHDTSVGGTTCWCGTDHADLGQYKTDDEDVTPDWIRWGDTVNGNGDSYKHQIVLHMADTLEGGFGGTTENVTGAIVTDGTVDNDPQADGISITLTVTMVQNPDL